VEQVAEQTLAAFTQPFLLQGEEVFITVSIGVALCPRDGRERDALLRFASTALLRAKQAGRNNYQMFHAGQQVTSRERVALETEVRNALARHEFELFYQGKYALADRRLVGAEALLRWRSPKRGLVSPADFIPLLEETG